MSSAVAIDRLITQYAARFAAETVSAEPSIRLEPTDENLRAILTSCVRPVRDHELPMVRQAFLNTYGSEAVEQGFLW